MFYYDELRSAPGAPVTKERSRMTINVEALLLKGLLTNLSKLHSRRDSAESEDT